MLETMECPTEFRNLQTHHNLPPLALPIPPLLEPLPLSSLQSSYSLLPLHSPPPQQSPAQALSHFSIYPNTTTTHVQPKPPRRPTRRPSSRRVKGNSNPPNPSAYDKCKLPPSQNSLPPVAPLVQHLQQAKFRQLAPNTSQQIPNVDLEQKLPVQPLQSIESLRVASTSVSANHYNIWEYCWGFRDNPKKQDSNTEADQEVKGGLPEIDQEKRNLLCIDDEYRHFLQSPGQSAIRGLNFVYQKDGLLAGALCNHHGQNLFGFVGSELMALKFFPTVNFLRHVMIKDDKIERKGEARRYFLKALCVMDDMHQDIQELLTIVEKKEGFRSLPQWKVYTKIQRLCHFYLMLGQEVSIGGEGGSVGKLLFLDDRGYFERLVAVVVSPLDGLVKYEAALQGLKLRIYAHPTTQ